MFYNIYTSNATAPATQNSRLKITNTSSARADGNDTLLVINRVGGSLLTTASTISSIFGLLYDDAENTFSFTFAAGVCQFRSTISDGFPRTVPRVSTVIPAGRSGWIKLRALHEQVGLLGAVFNVNSSAATGPGFSGARNLHKLTLNNLGVGTTAAPSLTIPVFAPTC